MEKEPLLKECGAIPSIPPYMSCIPTGTSCIQTATPCIQTATPCIQTATPCIQTATPCIQNINATSCTNDHGDVPCVRNDPADQTSSTTSKTCEKNETKYGTLLLVNIVTCLWTIALNLHSPVLTQYLYMRVKDDVYPNGTEPEKHNVTCFQNSSTEGFKLQEKAQQVTNAMQMEFTLTKSGCELVVTFILGSFSDFIGRRVLFVVPSAGYLIKDSILTAIIYWDLDLRFYYVGEMLEGVTGGSSLFKLACYTCVSDNTPAKGVRTLGMIAVDVTIAVAQASISSVTGVFIENTGFFYPSLASALMSVVVMVTIMCILSDNVKRRGASCRNLLTGFKNVFSSYFTEGSKRRKVLFWLGIVTYFTYFVITSTGNVKTLWQLNYPLCWSPEMIGYYSMASTMFQQVLSIPLARLLQSCVRDPVIAVWSCVVTMASNVLQAFSYTNWMMYGVAIVGCLSVSIGGILRSVLSQMTAPDRQGSFLASLSVMSIVSVLLGEPMFSYIYRYTVVSMRGAVFLTCAGGNLLCAILLTILAVLSNIYFKVEVTSTETQTRR
ncbi:lysosomal proton-coupled steroid conjugate and bile acid symporter SLC46A3-like [Haliotis asinina]|uniref:lysosomal proton-coupled steroid conjugate and bile acid symporter SLC46A3-like n=1 Tax=Haliotis asinina TaxID=109174 RepID=UPI0035326206